MLKIFDQNDVKPNEDTSGRIHRCDLCGRRFRWHRIRSAYYGNADEDPVVIINCGCQTMTDEQGEKLLKQKTKEGFIVRSW